MNKQPKAGLGSKIRALAGRTRGNLAMLSPNFYRYSAIEFLYWMAASAASFTVAYLQETGMTSSQVGDIMALLNVFGILAPPIWGMLSDKMRSVKKVLVICLVVGSAIFALMPLASRFKLGPLSAMVIVLPVSAFFRTPTTSLLDSWMISNVNKEPGLRYGSIRLWGSIGYAIMAFLFGVLIKRMGTNAITFYMYGLLNIPLLLLFAFQRDSNDSSAKKSLSFKELKIGRLAKNYYLMVFLFFNTILYLPVHGTFTFLPYLLEEVAGNSDSLGTVFSIKALMEVPMLIASAFLVKRFGLVKMIFLGGLLYTVEQFAYMACTNVPQVIGVMVIHGFAFGIYLACSVSYIFSLAPEGLSATAQTVCGALSSLAGILGNMVGGRLIETLGVRGYYGIAGSLELVALVIFLISFPIGRKWFKQELPPGLMSRAK